MSSHAMFGRYWPANSPIHKLDPRTKLIATLVLVVALFVAQTLVALGFMVAVTIVLFAISRVPAGQAIRSIAPLLFIVVLTAIFNIIYVKGGETIADWGWLYITTEGAYMAAFVSVRLVLLLLLGSLLTLTTTSLDITEATERLLNPLSRIGVPAHEFAFVMGTALRFLPQFADEFRSIRAAQLSRGAALSTSPSRGISAITSMVVPLFASVFRHADTLSAAMEARCYHGAEGRTRLHPLRFAKRDAAAAVILCSIMAAAFLLSFM